MNKDAGQTGMFFVDDSNIWIEAQRFAAMGNGHMPGLIDSDRDPRLRIDVGKMLRVILNGRSQDSSFLYGSRPPPTDSVWNVFKKSQFQTKIFDRSSGKEREIATAMSADMSAKATEINVTAKYEQATRWKKAQTTFIAITGDRGMIPPVEKVLSCGIHVELWAWSSGLSKDYERLQADNAKLFSVKLLDWIFDNISFTNFRSTRPVNVESFRQIVICDIVDAEENDVESRVCEKLITLGRLFYVMHSETKTEMHIEFPMATSMDPIVREVRKLFKDKLTVMSWLEYKGHSRKGLPVTKTSNKFSLLDDSARSSTLNATTRDVWRATGTTNRAEPNDRLAGYAWRRDTSSSDNTSGWTTVDRSDSKSHNHRILRPERCRDGIRCKKACSCEYQHTSLERGLFMTYAGSTIQLAKWKTKQCKKIFPHMAMDCPFAHSHVEAWCLICHYEGHYTDSCRYRT